MKPIANPTAERLGALWRSLPPVGQAFVAFAVIDLVVRVLGIGGVTLGLVPDVQITFVSAFLPHFPLVLLPTVLLLRRRDAATATPLVFRGAVVVALVELLVGPLVTWSSVIGTSVLSWTLIQVLGAVARAAGYVILGLGLHALRTTQPGPTLAGVANLVATVMAAESLLGLSLVLLYPPTDYGIPDAGGLMLLASVVPLAGILAFAYLARVIVQGTGDPGRPVVATTLAMGAITVGSVGSFIVVMQDLFILAGSFVTVPALVAGLGLGWAGSGLVLTLLVVAFGLGLADTSVRMGARGAADPVGRPDEPESVQWPAPGGEVPAFGQVQHPATEPTGASEPAPEDQRPESKESPG